jgi:hypothetical protein
MKLVAALRQLWRRRLLVVLALLCAVLVEDEMYTPDGGSTDPDERCSSGSSPVSALSLELGHEP